jgi:hypothetical protein
MRITIEDIRNPLRKSGFDYVNSKAEKPGGSNTSVRWRGESGSKPAAVAPGKSIHDYMWRGPSRKTPEEAAQDYCDYINAQTLLTIEDIRNPKRKSGFDHVNTIGGPSRKSADMWRAAWRIEGVSNSAGNFNQAYARGPARPTPEEAAQDYCDYINGQQQAVPAAKKTKKSNIIRVERAKLKFVRHPQKPRKTKDTVTAEETLTKPKTTKEGPGWVYCIGMVTDDSAVKIGESRDEPKFRLEGLQTGNPHELYLIGFIETKERLRLEDELHQKYAAYQHNSDFVGEWFAKHDDIVNEFTATRKKVSA